MRPTTGGERTPSGAPVSFGPSPQTQRYGLGTPRPHHRALRQHDGQETQRNIQDPFREDALSTWELDGEDHFGEDAVDLAEKVDELETVAPSCAPPPTPSSSSLEGPRRIQGHLVRPSCREEKDHQQHAIVAS